MFCNDCIVEYFETESTCPTCKISLLPHPEKLLMPDKLLQDIIEVLIPSQKKRPLDAMKLTLNAALDPKKKLKVDGDAMKQKDMPKVPFRLCLDRQ